MEEKELTAQQQEKANKKYFEKLILYNQIIAIIYVVIFVAHAFIALNLVMPETELLTNLIIMSAIVLSLFIMCWFLAMPVRIISYRTCKKHGTLNQNFGYWFLDWVKILLTYLIIYVPFFSVTLTALYEIYYYHSNYFIPAFILFLILTVVVVNIQKTLVLWLIMGAYRLKNGEYFDYWNTFAIKTKLKTYPIFVLKIKEKAKWANAFAVGIKNRGFIITSDLLLEDFSKEEFAAIMAHETAHIENYDHLKRFFPLIGIIVIGIIFLILLGFLNTIEILILFLALIISILAILISATSYYQKQEFIADQFAKSVLNNGESLSKALTYIYEVNRLPKEPKKFLGRNVGFHPSLEERVNKLLDIEHPQKNEIEEESCNCDNDVKAQNSDSKEEDILVDKEEKDRQVFFKRIDSSITQVGMISLILFFVSIWLVYVLNTSDNSLLFRIIINCTIFLAYFLIGGALGFPISLSIYKEGKKRELIKQSPEEWTNEYIKSFVIQVFILVPVLGIGISLIIQYFSTTLNEFIFSLIAFFGIIILSIFLIEVINLFTFNKIYKLKKHEKLKYWESLAAKSNIKPYPIYIIGSKEKIIWANAVAFGFKNFGFILTNDIVLENTSNDQFAAIMAHEIGHIEDKQNYTNLAFLLFLIISTIYLAYYSFSISFIDDNAVTILSFITVIVFIYFIFRRNTSPASKEFEADQFSKKILKSGKPLAEALKYLHEVNKTPNKIKIGNHPSLEERIERLLEGDNE